MAGWRASWTLIDVTFSDPSARRRRTTLILVALAVSGAIALASVTVYVMFFGPVADPMSRVAECRDQAHKQMRSPATARFTGGESTTSAPDGRVLITGDYTWSDETGYVGPGTYWCELSKDGGGYRIDRVRLTE